MVVAGVMVAGLDRFTCDGGCARADESTGGSVNDGVVVTVLVSTDVAMESAVEM